MKRCRDQAPGPIGGIAGTTALAAAGGLALLAPFVAYRTPILVGVTLLTALGWLWLLARRPCASGRRTGLLAANLASASLALAVSAPSREQQTVHYLFELWIMQP